MVLRCLRGSFLYGFEACRFMHVITLCFLHWPKRVSEAALYSVYDLGTKGYEIREKERDLHKYLLA